MRTKLHQTASNEVNSAKAGAAGQPGDLLTALGVLLLGLLLCFIGSGLLGQLGDASARKQETGVEELLGLGAAAAGAGIVAWWILSLACAAVTAILERKGRPNAAAATRRLSPAFMQRLVLGALSVHLLAGPAAHAAVTGPGPEWAPTQRQSSSAPAVPATEGATRGESGTPGAAPTQGHTPRASGEPLTAAPELATVPESATEREPSTAPEHASVPELAGAPEATPPSTFHPGWQPATPVPDPGMLAAPYHRAVEGKHGQQDEDVTVHAGDTLWDIAARHLGPGVSDLDIALHWPRWYEANRKVIGQDPDVLLPGQILQPPLAGQK
ncbi:LysM peptidoglycan-binding domain-containing protein [Pseudarthrobacter scleromae]|uniref:LysM peptidoglycan-binding domain-containing protein n=1 Tax=Pseudarthrobacter scleromae TaxID=158897 RepID=UPI001668138B|nr:LysM domain-containing protein [Pseudarthrobacter scleromae]